MNLISNKKQLNVVMCSWRSPELLKVCIPSLLDSFTVDASIKVVLNEGDKESIEFLSDNKIEFVNLNWNAGTLAVDFASSLLNAEYWMTTNDDMIFYKGFDQNLINIINEYYPASASCSLVEPFDSGNPVVIHDDLGEFTQARDKFWENCKNKKYKFNKKHISYTHPFMIKMEDYFKIGGYSDNLDFNWHPGYGLDNFTPFRLWSMSNATYKFIASNKDFVYHKSSATNNKLAPEIKSRSGYSYFVQKTGMDFRTFNSWINCFSEIN